MATYYWVGGTGTWSATGNTQFAITSGGVPTVLNPTSADAVIFDANSGTGTCTTSAGAVAIGITLGSATLGLTLGANLTISGTFAFNFGPLNLGNNKLTCNIFSSNNANVRSIAFGTGDITVTGNAATVWTTGTLTNFSYTGTPTVNCTYSGSTGTRTIQAGNAGATESNCLSFNISAGSDIVAVSFVCKSLNFTGFTGTFTNINRTVFGDLTLSSGMTLTAGALGTQFTATSGIQQITTNGNSTINFPITINAPGGTIRLQDNLTTGATRLLNFAAGTLDLNNRTFSVGLVGSSFANIRSIAFGTGNITITGSGTVWNTANTTNFSYTGTSTINISNNSATATTVSTGTMTEAQSLNFNYTVGTYTLTDTSAVYKSVNFTGFTGTIPNSTRTIYGGATFVSGMTLTAGANATTFAATSGTYNITTAKTWDFPITFNGIGGTWAFQDALTQGTTRAFTITNGTVQLKASTTNTVGSFSTTGTNVKYLQSTTAGTQATINQSSGTIPVTYLNIKDISAQGGAVWSAYTVNANVNAGNDSGWNFGGNFMPMFG